MDEVFLFSRNISEIIAKSITHKSNSKILLFPLFPYL